MRAQLNLRNSGVTNDLRESASEQIRREMTDTDFEPELTKDTTAEEQGDEDTPPAAFHPGDQVRITFGSYPVQTVDSVRPNFAVLRETGALVYFKDLGRVPPEEEEQPDDGKTQDNEGKS